MKVIYLFLILFCQIHVIRSSHYRGSMLTWRVINSTSNPLIIELLHRHSWSYVWYPCTSAQIAAGNYTIGTGNGSGNITCAVPCPLNSTVITSVASTCTAANSVEDYSVSEARYNISAPLDKRFRVLFAAGSWLSLVTGGTKWSVCTEMNTYKRSNGRYNQAPIITLLPIMRLRRYLTYNIKINVADNDFDRYKCIWSNTTQECADICRSSLTLPNTTYLNETSCILQIRPEINGFYALAVTVLDFENDTDTIPLSRVPIQFILKVWSTAANCTLPPIYLGDAPADQCIFVEPGQILTVYIRLKVRCPNATLNNVIGVSPIGFTQSSTYTDPYDLTIYVYKVTYVATANQIGQNLYCFAGVDSIGNQGDTTCLRFTVQIASESQNSLYLNNATHFPTGLVSKYQSTWTLIYPTGVTFTRPRTKAHVRFKLASTGADFIAYDIVKHTTNVDYQVDRLVITTNVIFTSGEKYFISLDPGVFLPIATCLRDSMGVTDASFWPFEIASEPNTTSIITTTTSLITATTTMRNRTVPTVRSISSTVRSSTSEKTTAVFITTTASLTTQKLVSPSSAVLPVGAIVGITIGSVIVVGTIILILQSVRNHQTKSLNNLSTSTTQLFPVSATMHQYKLATRAAPQSANGGSTIHKGDISPVSTTVQNNLVSIEC